MLYDLSYELLDLLIGSTHDITGYSTFFGWFVVAFAILTFYFCVIRPFMWFFTRILPGGSKKKGLKKYNDD